MPVKKGKISQKELDFCTLAVNDNYKSGQLNIACHFRVKSAIVASVYDQQVSRRLNPKISCANRQLIDWANPGLTETI